MHGNGMSGREATDHGDGGGGTDPPLFCGGTEKARKRHGMNEVDV